MSNNPFLRNKSIHVQFEVRDVIISRSTVYVNYIMSCGYSKSKLFDDFRLV
jgi:hypothetical protein